jgi:hypothetical protein
MKTKTRNLIRQAIQGYAWPGGYPLFLITEDGGALCPACVRAEVRTILTAIRDDDTRGGWYPVAVDANWEDPELFCDHCGSRIGSAYAEDGVTA